MKTKRFWAVLFGATLLTLTLGADGNVNCRFRGESDCEFLCFDEADPDCDFLCFDEDD